MAGVYLDGCGRSRAPLIEMMRVGHQNIHWEMLSDYMLWRKKWREYTCRGSRAPLIWNGASRVSEHILILLDHIINTYIYYHIYPIIPCVCMYTMQVRYIFMCTSYHIYICIYSHMYIFICKSYIHIYIIIYILNHIIYIMPYVCIRYR